MIEICENAYIAEGFKEGDKLVVPNSMLPFFIQPNRTFPAICYVPSNEGLEVIRDISIIELGEPDIPKKWAARSTHVSRLLEEGDTWIYTGDRCDSSTSKGITSNGRLVGVNYSRRMGVVVNLLTNQGQQVYVLTATRKGKVLDD